MEDVNHFKVYIILQCKYVGIDPVNCIAN